MSILKNLFGSREDPLLAQASRLVVASNTNAIAAYIPVIDKFPVVRAVTSETFDFFVTVAGVFMATTRLTTMKVDDERKKRLFDVIERELQKWNARGVAAFENCQELFESEFDRLRAARHDPRFIGSDALGLWIAWNTLGRQPHTREEVEYRRAIGVMVVHAFSDWWPK